MKISIMHIIDLSYFVKICHLENKRISANSLRYLHRAGGLHLSGTTCCIYENVIVKKYLILLIATVPSGASLTAYAVQLMSSLNSGQLRPTGTISAAGASNLGDLGDKLAEEACGQGVKGYVIDSTGEDDQIPGTTTICK